MVAWDVRTMYGGLSRERAYDTCELPVVGVHVIRNSKLIEREGSRFEPSAPIVFDLNPVSVGCERGFGLNTWVVV